MTIPTERLRVMQNSGYVFQDEGRELATELLAARDALASAAPKDLDPDSDRRRFLAVVAERDEARDALAALTKERDEARRASAHWLNRCHELGDEIDELRAAHVLVPADVREWAHAVDADTVETEHLLTYDGQCKAAKWILTRAALAATEGEQGGGR
jgi:hypothetical protein